MCHSAQTALCVRLRFSESVLGLCRSFWRAGAAGEGLVEEVLDKLLKVLSAGNLFLATSHKCRELVTLRRPAQTAIQTAIGCLLQVSEQLRKHTYSPSLKPRLLLL